MNKIIFALYAFALSPAVFASEAGQWINCGNAPLRSWGAYYCVSGRLDIKNQRLTQVSFGTCEGSVAAQESEPLTVIEDLTGVPNSKLAATSSAWKNAIPFDLSNEDFGKTVLLIREADTQEKPFKARIKVTKAQDGVKKDAIVECR